MKMEKLGFFTLSTFLFSSVVVDCFFISFNTADHCTGATLGTFNGGVGSGCQTAINNSTDSTDLIIAPSDAFNVITYPNSILSQDQGAAVAFYSNQDCSVLIGLSNVASCVGAGAYNSYEVIKLTDAWAGQYNLSPPQVFSRAPNITATFTAGQVLSEAAESTTASISLMTSSPCPTTQALYERKHTPKHRRQQLAVRKPAKDLEHMVSGSPIKHGAVRRTRNGVFKFHQIAERVWRGVDVEAWDDEIHQRSTEPVKVPRRVVPDIAERNIPPSLCNMVRSCMVDSGEENGFAIRDVSVQLLNTVRAYNSYGDNWNFLLPGLVIEMVNDQGVSQGFVYAQTDLRNQMVQTCSSKGTQGDAFQSALAAGVDGTSVTDMRIDVRQLSGIGVTDSLYVSTRSAAHIDKRIRPICEAVEVNF